MATPVLVLGQGRVDELCMLAAMQCMACLPLSLYAVSPESAA